MGASRLAAWLKKRGARNAAVFAAKAVDAAHAQHTVLATQATGSRLVALRFPRCSGVFEGWFDRADQRKEGSVAGTEEVPR